MRHRIDFNQRIFPEPNTGCWLSIGPTNEKGHVRVSPLTHSGFRYAHRYSYFINVGDFDRHLCILHKCDVPSCVNPDHLFTGTIADNIADCVSKGRHKRGTKSKYNRFSETQVIEMRQLHSQGRTNKEIRDTLGLHYSLASQVNAICKRITWKHI